MHTYLLHSLLTETAKKYPERNAVVMHGRALTYSELDKMSNQLAVALKEQGIKSGDRAGIMLPKSIESIISVFGILKAGGVYVPIDPLSPVLRMNSIITNCEIQCLITSSQSLSRILSEPDKNLKKIFIVTQPYREGGNPGRRDDDMTACGNGSSSFAGNPAPWHPPAPAGGGKRLPATGRNESRSSSPGRSRCLREPPAPAGGGSTNEQLGINPEAQIELISWEHALQNAAPWNQTISVCDVHPAYILHTSGSTGAPKGVVISHLNALSFVTMAAHLFKINDNDRIASHAPLHFDLSIFDVFCAVQSGATIVLVPEFLAAFPLKLAEYIEREQISVWNSVSSVLTMLADRGKLGSFQFSALRLVHFSGDTLPVKYLRILKRHMKNADFYNIYGQTEANSSLFYRVDAIPDNEVWKIPIGKPFPNFEVFAVNDAGKAITGPGEEGELYINSATVALGYWQDETRTRERFVPDPRRLFCNDSVYRTGDLVRIDSEGNYVFAGRKDHMVKSRGYRIELDEIEIVLNSHPSVKHAVALAVPDELVGNKIAAIVSVVSEGVLDEHELIDYCSLRLPKYMLPEIIRFFDTLPTTSTGKIDRKKLEATAGLSL